MLGGGGGGGYGVEGAKKTKIKITYTNLFSN